MTADDRDPTEHEARRDRLTGQYGRPEHISAADALTLARAAEVPLDLPADVWIHASIYRDDEAADAWLGSNLEHYGHPTLARFPLGDGRVVGILDLRPALERARAGA